MEIYITWRPMVWISPNEPVILNSPVPIKWCTQSVTVEAPIGTNKNCYYIKSSWCKLSILKYKILKYFKQAQIVCPICFVICKLFLNFAHIVSIGTQTEISAILNSWTHDLNWLYIRRSTDIMYVIVRSNQGHSWSNVY